MPGLPETTWTRARWPVPSDKHIVICLSGEFTYPYPTHCLSWANVSPLSEYNTTIKWSHTHLQLMFTNGSYCDGKDAKEGVRASTVVEFRCDHSTGHVGTPRILAQLPPGDNEACGFFIEWRTSVSNTHMLHHRGFMIDGLPVSTPVPSTRAAWASSPFSLLCTCLVPILKYLN